jgi:hypothetical protein
LAKISPLRQKRGFAIAYKSATYATDLGHHLRLFHVRFGIGFALSLPGDMPHGGCSRGRSGLPPTLKRAMEVGMSTLFHDGSDRLQHLSEQFLEQHREDILYAAQIPVALTALAALYFLA